MINVIQKVLGAGLFAAIATYIVVGCAAGVKTNLYSHQTTVQIGFGSCLAPEQPTDIFDAINTRQPDWFLFTGDLVYGDDLASLKKAYQNLGQDPRVATLLNSARIAATWDDGEYGLNDGGAESKIKEEAKKLFLDAIGEPQDSERRKHDAVYHAQNISVGNLNVQIILLDTRWFRSPLKRAINPGPGTERYVPDNSISKTFLGSAQWQWLEHQLLQKADLRLLVSSIQFLPNNHGFEKWANLPAERERLLRILENTAANGVILISGDRHSGSVHRLNRKGTYPLVEFTASSFNLVASTKGNKDSLGVGDAHYVPNFGWIKISADGRVSISLRGSNGEILQSFSLWTETMK
jgi:alkaline phosphatase D